MATRKKTTKRTAADASSKSGAKTTRKASGAKSAAAAFDRSLPTVERFSKARNKGKSLAARERSADGQSNKDALYRFVITRYVATGSTPTVDECMARFAHGRKKILNWLHKWPGMFDAGIVKHADGSTCVPKASRDWQPTSKRAAKAADSKGSPLRQHLDAIKKAKAAAKKASKGK